MFFLRAGLLDVGLTDFAWASGEVDASGAPGVAAVDSAFRAATADSSFAVATYAPKSLLELRLLVGDRDWACVMRSISATKSSEVLERSAESFSCDVVGSTSELSDGRCFLGLRLLKGGYSKLVHREHMMHCTSALHCYEGCCSSWIFML